jgi:hypothetical protein
MERTPVLLSYLLILVGFLLAIVLVAFLPIPVPPACGTAACNVADWASLIGLVLLVIGISGMTVTLFTKPRPPSATPTSPLLGFPSGPAAPPTGGAVGPAPPHAPPANLQPFCPTCGAYVTAGTTTCPQCGRPIPP